MHRQTPPEYRALVVENDRDFRLDLIYCVESLDAGVSVVADVSGFDEAAEVLRTQDIDLLITDINLTDDLRFDVGHSDGTELARLARVRYGVPSIFLTAFADYDPAVVREAAASDPVGFLQKSAGGLDGQIPDLIRLALRRLELTRRERELALQMEAVVRQLSDGLLYIDEDGYILDFDDSVGTLLECDPDSLLDQHWEDVLRIEAMGQGESDTLRKLIDAEVEASLPTVALRLPSGNARLVSISVAPAEHRRQACTLVLMRDLDKEADELAQLQIAPGTTLAVFGVNLGGFQEDVSPTQLRILMREIQSAIMARCRPGDEVQRPSATTVTVTMPDTDEGTAFSIARTLQASVEEALHVNRPALRLHAGIAHRSEDQPGIAVVAEALNALAQVQQDPDEKVRVGASAPTVGEMNRTLEAGRRSRINVGFRFTDRLLAIDMQMISSVGALLESLAPALDEIRALGLYGLATQSQNGLTDWLGLMRRGDEGIEPITADAIPKPVLRPLSIALNSGVDELTLLRADLFNILVLPLQSADKVIAHLFAVTEVGRNSEVTPPSMEERQLGTVAGRFLAMLLQQCREYREPPQPVAHDLADDYNVYSLRPDLSAIDRTATLIRLDVPVAVVAPPGLGRRQMLESAACSPSQPVARRITVTGANELNRMRSEDLDRWLRASAEQLLIIRHPHELLPSQQEQLAGAIMTRRISTGDALPSMRFAATLPADPEILRENGELHAQLASALAGGIVRLQELRGGDEENLRWAERILAAEAKRTRSEPRRFATDARRALKAHAWPGNLREMRERIREAVGRSRRSEITILDLGLFRLRALNPEPGQATDQLQLPEAVYAALREVIDVIVHISAPPGLVDLLEDEIVEATLDRHRADQDPMQRSAEFLAVKRTDLKALVSRASASAGIRQSLPYWQSLRISIKAWISSERALPSSVRQRLGAIVARLLEASEHLLELEQAAVIAGCSAKEYRSFRQAD